MSSDKVFPTAKLRRVPRFSWYKFLPMLAAAASLGMFYAVYTQRGLPVYIQFQQGHGLKQGDTLRYRGIEVGRVHEVKLSQELQGVAVEVRLYHEAKKLARQGSRFWIVRPQVDLSGASGLDTLVGANYLGVLPGEGDSQRHFIGLETPPLLDLLESGGLEIILSTPGQGQLRRGAPVSYRQIPVGTLLDVNLAPDAGSVEAHAYISPSYAHLIRENTRFWKASGAKLSAGWLSGLSFQIDSVQSLIAGGVVLAVPPEAGAPAKAGQRFQLHDDPLPAWLEWQPRLFKDDENAAFPRPLLLPARLTWTPKNYLERWREVERSGYLLPVAKGLLGPADLIATPSEAETESVRLHLEEISIDPAGTVQILPDGLALLPYQHQQQPWPSEQTRRPTQAEDTLVSINFQNGARFIAKEYYQTEENGWVLKIPDTKNLEHGAAVVSAADGALLGLLLREEEIIKVVFLPSLD